jgi:hypothetical protein
VIRTVNQVNPNVRDQESTVDATPRRFPEPFLDRWKKRLGEWRPA